MSALNVERRKEPRHAAKGKVSVRVRGQLPEIAFHAELVDKSSTGLRLRHDCAELRSGLEVEIVFSDGQKQGRVMWTAIVDEKCESGFLLA